MRVTTLLAPNPGPFTGPGTNTYLVASAEEALVIDPGPVIEEHRRAIHDALADLSPQAILVTHSHPDHAPLATILGGDLQIPVLGHARSDDFEPDELLADGDHVPVGQSSLEVVATPGHADDHLCFLVDRMLFTGDHIMGGSTVMVEHMGKYLASLERVAALRTARLLPGHGPIIDNPSEVIDYYIAHRLEREQQIIAALQSGSGTVGAVVESVYADVDKTLHPLAALSVTAHLRKLADEGAVTLSESGDVWDAVVRMLAT